MTFEAWQNQVDGGLNDEQSQIARSAWNSALEHVMEALVEMVEKSDGERSAILDEVENVCDRLSAEITEPLSDESAA